MATAKVEMRELTPEMRERGADRRWASLGVVSVCSSLGSMAEPPKPNGNTKDPAKQAEQIREKLEKRQQVFLQQPWFGLPVAVCLLSADNEVLLRYDASGESEQFQCAAAGLAVRYLEDLVGNAEMPWQIVGIGSRVAVQQLVSAAILSGEKFTLPFLEDVRRGPTWRVDPHHLLVPTAEQQDMLPAESLMRSLGLPVAPLTGELSADAAATARNSAALFCRAVYSPGPE